MKTIQARNASRLALRSGKLLACLALLSFDVANDAAGAGPWTASAQYSSIQGTNQWFYQERPPTGGSVTNLSWQATGGYNDPAHGSTGYYSTTDAVGSGWIYWSTTQPDGSYDTLRKWVAPFTGVVSISGRVCQDNFYAGTGVNARVEKNGSVIWGSKAIASGDHVGYVTDSDLGAVSVNSGDSLAFIVNGAIATSTFVYWDPTITQTASYNADAQFSSVQGQNCWYYQQRPVGGGGVTNLTWIPTGGFSYAGHGSTGYYSTNEGSNYGWEYWGDARPGATYDVIRKWVSPTTGVVSISGQVYMDALGSAGQAIKATVEHPLGTVIWGPKTIAYNDAIGYSMDADLGAVSVSSGDSIAFIVNDNGTWSAVDGLRLNPTISFTASSAPNWTLNTSDTLLTLSILNNAPAITRLEDATTHYNWITSPQALPLLRGANTGAVAWSYTTASVDTSSGTKVTLTFTGISSSLTLSQCWWAHSGGGPVEETQTLTNNTGSGLTINDSDVIATDVTVVADNTVTLYRFDRSSKADGDTWFSTGVLTNDLSVNSIVGASLSNSFTNATYFSGFVMLDVGEIHGLYMGYSCDFGQFSFTSPDGKKVRSLFRLWDTSSPNPSFTLANGATIPLPGMFYGTYSGDVDCGSNKMKAWFWNNKITPTIKSTTNEPLVDVAASIDWEFQASAFFNTDYPSLHSWGVEMVKEDAQWTDDYNTHANFGWDWVPNYPSQWPNGFTDGSYIHNRGMLYRLWMGNTFNDVDLSSNAGVTSEEGALIARMDPVTAAHWTGGFDYWRADENSETDTNYLSHLGLLQVVDYMISNRSNFRWEGNSGGGSKKSFDALQRMSFTCIDDEDVHTQWVVEDFRISFYANSYVINPVQLSAQNVQILDTGFRGENTAAFGNYMFRTGMLSAWENYLANGISIQDNLYKTTIPLYKNHQRPILRGADVYHVLPICNKSNWDGIEYFNTALNKGSVILLKPNSSVNTFPGVHLKGLIPTGTYSLTFQDRPSLNSSGISGSSLMLGGAGIGSFSGTANEYDSEIIWINY